MNWKKRLVRFRSFWIFPALAVALLAFTGRAEPNRATNLALFFLLGLLSWSLLEYGLHRFIFHVDIASPTLQRMINASHLEHHTEPRNADHLLVKTGYGMGVSVLLFAAAFAATRNWFHATAIMSGVWAGFLYYEFVHYRVHLTLGNSSIMMVQRRAHFHHHFRDSRSCFGVTTPLWDYVFRTTRALD